MALNTEEARIRHLVRRAGFGATPLEIHQYCQIGLAGTVKQLLADPETADSEPLDIWSLRNPDNGNLAPPQVGAWWIHYLITSPHPLREKLALFWHDHFGVSAEVVKAGIVMYQHVQLLRDRALDDFPSLLEAVAKDPAMLVFLDGITNIAGKPNENFAREVMELYTLGVNNYSERDIQEAARAFSGWSVERPTQEELALNPPVLPGFRFRRRLHDNGEKTVLGHTGNLSGEDVLGLLVDQPSCASYIATKLWEWFAYYDPEPELISRLASAYRDSSYRTSVLLRDIFTSEEFYSLRAERALFKSPADFCVGVLRCLGGAELLSRLSELLVDQGLAEVEINNRLAQGMQRLYGAVANMGMQLLYPPSVAGWEGGEAWVNSATMLERIKFAQLFDPDSGALRLPQLLRNQRVLSADDVVDYLAGALDSGLPSDKLNLIKDSIAAGLPAEEPQHRQFQFALFAAARLIFACPEFQMC